MSPSTSATFAAAANGFSLVMFREFATTLYPRSRNASTSPAPIPREAPVIIVVLPVFAIYSSIYQSAHTFQNADPDGITNNEYRSAMGCDTRDFLGGTRECRSSLTAPH